MIRKLLITVLLLCGAAWGQYQPLVQSHGLNNLQTCPYLHNVVSGDILIVGASTEGSLTGISDTLSSSWSLLASSTANSITTRVWIATAASSGADTATVTGSLSFNNIACLEFLPDFITTTLDTSSTGGFTGTPATITTTAMSTTFNYDTLYCYIAGFRSSAQLWATSPWIETNASSNNDSGGGGYFLTGALGSYSATFGNASNDKGNYVCVAMKPTTSITIVNSALPTASTSNSYSYQMIEAGGTASDTWSISSGSLPSGLSISSGGLISGTPTGGTTTPTIQVTDGTHTTTKALTLTVNSSASTPAFVSGSSSPTPTVTAGDILILHCQGNQSTAGASEPKITLPTDSLSTVYRLIAAQGQANNNSVWDYIWAGQVASSGTATITVSSGCTSPLVMDISGGQGFYDISTATGGTASTGTISGSSITTPAPNSMLYAFASAYTNNATITANSPLTGDGNTSGANNPVDTAYVLESSAGSYTPAFTLGSNSSPSLWSIMSVALRPSTSGTVNTNHRRAWVTQSN